MGITATPRMKRVFNSRHNPYRKTGRLMPTGSKQTKLLKKYCRVCLKAYMKALPEDP